jgi:protein SCO1/2
MLFFAKAGKHQFSSLPYFTKDGELEATEVGEDDSGIHSLPAFSLTNQNGDVFTRDSLEGKIWLTAFFSTNSPFVTLATEQLLWLNYRYRDELDIGILCFTLDSEYDTPERLFDYVEQSVKYNASKDKWQFLTGDQQAIYDLIEDGFLLQDTSKNLATMWLVDFDGHLRARYNANYEEEMKHAIEDIALLKKEFDLEVHNRSKEP